MIKVVAQFYIKKEKIEEFLNHATQCVEATRKEDGCISYEVYKDTKDKGHMTFIETWEDQAAIDFHFKTAHFNTFLPIANELSEKPGVIDSLTQVL